MSNKITRRKFLTLSSLLPLLAYADEILKPWHLGHHGDFEFKKVSQNVYIMHGINSSVDTDAQCFVDNPAFIESKNGIILIDSGASYHVGKAILTQIKRVSDKPIIAIFNTHHHSDHWFANGAIKEVYPNVSIYAHHDFIDYAKNQYFRADKSQFNYQKAKKVAFPNIFVKDKEQIQIDSEIFEIEYPPVSHTSTDIVITHKKSNIIFMGDVALESILSNFVSGSSILGNLAFLEKIMKRDEYALYVAGHGRAGDKAFVIAPYYRYLKVIKEEVEQAYKDDISIFELSSCKTRIIERLTWDESFNFPLRFLDNHIQFIYLEFEEKLDIL